jgi:hypothetical protein
MDNALVAVARSFEHAKRLADAQRRAEASVLLDYYHNDMEEDFADVLRDVFVHPEEKVVIELNPLRKFAHSRAQVFAEDPVVTVMVEGQDEPSERDTDLWNYLADRGEWYDALRDANALEHVVGALHVMPHAVQEGFLDLWLITPDITKVMQRTDAPHKAGAVLYSLFSMPDTHSVQNEQEWAVWTAHEHFIVDDNGKFVRYPDENMPGKNPYGLIPLKKISSRRPPAGDYWPIGARDMLSVNRAVNVALVSMEHAIINSGFTQGWSVNIPPNVLSQRGPDTWMGAHGVKEGDVRPEIGGVNFDSDLEAQKVAVEYIMQQAAILRGVPASEFRISGAPESGVARWLDRLPLHEKRKLDTAKWRRDMRGLYRIIKAVWAVERTRPEVMVPPEFDYDFTENSQIHIDFAEPQFPESESERLDRWEKEIGMGITSPVDVIMERNPDMNRDAAKAKLVEVAQEKSEFKGAGILASIGLTPEE